MIEPMAKIEIVGLFEELDSTLDILQQTGTVQIEDIPTIEEADKTHIHRIHLDDTKEHLLKSYEELLSTVSEILEVLKIGIVEEVTLESGTTDSLHSLSPDELLDHISPIAREIRRLSRHRKNLIQDIESARQYETLIKMFLPLLEKAGPVSDLEQIGIILKEGESSVLPILRERIDEITSSKTLIFHQQMTDGEIGVFIVIAPEDLSVVRQLLGHEGVAEYHIPREFRKKNLQESIGVIRQRIENIPHELELIDQQLLETKRKNAALLRFVHSHCTDKLNQLRILSRLVRTRYTFMISGWTPISSLNKLKNKFRDHFNERVYVGSVKMSNFDFLQIPTFLKNSNFLRSFELLTKLLPPPVYGNIDATPFITLFFPIFFGVILGDMGYGIALLALAGIIKWKSKKGSYINDAGTVAIAAGISTVFFGFLFGEFLGDIGEHFGLKPLAPWLHRAGAIETILLLALGLGTIHIVLGFILKTYISIIMRHIKGVIEGISKIIVILGTTGVFIQLFLGFPIIIRYLSLGVVGIGILGVAFTEGFIGLLEIFSVFGNILSYSRIMAIGLASVILAIVANRLATEVDNIVVGILIGFIIHLINFIMGIFSPTIHSLRLHYVEFFSKFFLPSGRPFQPFKRIGGNLS